MNLFAPKRKVARSNRAGDANCSTLPGWGFFCFWYRFTDSASDRCPMPAGAADPKSPGMSNNSRYL